MEIESKYGKEFYCKLSKHRKSKWGNVETTNKTINDLVLQNQLKLIGY